MWDIFPCEKICAIREHSLGGEQGQPVFSDVADGLNLARNQVRRTDA